MFKHILMQREKLVITKEDARDAVYEDSPDYIVIEDETTDHGRWPVHHSVVLKRVSDGRLFSGYYSQGATEYQDEQPFENNEPDFTEVFEVQKTITVYE